MSQLNQYLPSIALCLAWSQGSILYQDSQQIFTNVNPMRKKKIDMFMERTSKAIFITLTVKQLFRILEIVLKTIRISEHSKPIHFANVYREPTTCYALCYALQSRCKEKHVLKDYQMRENLHNNHII